MIKPEVLDALVAAGCSAEQIAAAVKADQARSSGAARQARYRARKASQSDERDVTSVTVTGDPSPKEKSPTPPKEITPSPVSEPVGSSTDSAREFAEFWSLFPNKVGKRDAQKAFGSARKRAPVDAILAGLRRYVAKTDDRPWCNPTTFLNQDRWEDQPAPAPQRQATAPPGRRMNAVEALASLRARERHEPPGPVIDHRNAELLRPDEPELRGVLSDLGQAMRWPDGSGHH